MLSCQNVGLFAVIRSFPGGSICGRAAGARAGARDYRRYADPIGPWTSDAILKAFRFTNTYRAADRVSQYLICEVQARPDRPQTAREMFFRTILFKFFNRIDTWEALELCL